ncbi:MAG: hypothetical protein QM665_01575 [Desulfovibrio sp.]
MNFCRSFAALARNVSLLALLGCLAACQMPFGLGQRAPEPKPQPVAPAPVTGPCVVLALPSSGTYAPIAGKVRHGAQMAQSELAASGVKMRLETVNTEAADWLQRLDALPQACAVVGAPCRRATTLRPASMVSSKKEPSSPLCLRLSRVTKARAHGAFSPARKTRSTRLSTLPALA